MIFLEKNKIDLDRGTDVVITITDAVATDTGADYVDYLRNRSNDSGWGTTDSTDAANTQIDIDMGEESDINRILLLRQNFKAYTIQYSTDDVTYSNFSTSINVSGNSEADKYHTFNTVAARYIRIIVTGTFVTNDDKYCSQIIITESIGSLSTIQPHIADVEFGRNRRFIKTVSGKGRVKRNVGAASFTLRKNNVTDATDLSLLETLHDYHNGFIVWPNGDANTNQSAANAAILNARIFWRRQDVFTMNIASELKPEFNTGRYAFGMDQEIDFREVV
jgi:hypothetical protein